MCSHGPLLQAASPKKMWESRGGGYSHEERGGGVTTPRDHAHQHSMAGRALLSLHPDKRTHS